MLNSQFQSPSAENIPYFCFLPEEVKKEEKKKSKDLPVAPHGAGGRDPDLSCPFLAYLSDFPP